MSQYDARGPPAGPFVLLHPAQLGMQAVHEGGSEMGGRGQME
ncbi:hypothetical protein [Desulforhabdus amnigena]|nr:hypothetical protein [Desulforhabdus amnigena]